MSSVCEVLFLFWFVVIYLLSSWDDMEGGIELLTDGVWAAEDDKTGFLSVGVGIFDQLYFQERPISLPMVPMSTIKPKYEKWAQLRKLNKLEIWDFLWMIKMYFWLYPPLLKTSKIEKVKWIDFDECSNNFFDRPLSTQGI